MRCSMRRESACKLTAGLFLAVVAAAPLAAQYDPELEYKDRGDRHEGLKRRLQSGFDIELLSARIDFREESEGWPEELRLLFHLPEADSEVFLSEPEKVFVTVRPRRPQTTYYWLDKVRPPSPWRVGAVNGFAWPTATVLRQLTSLRLDDLGAVVRLQQDSPGKREYVAPALLYHSQAPSEVTGYRFTLKTNGTAVLTCKIYHGETEVELRPRKRERAGSPFTVRWKSAQQPEGWYRLVISGHFEMDEHPLDKEIVFYHKAALTAGGTAGGGL